MVEIILDPSIRDWVVLPMVIIFGCSAMVRHYVTLLLKTEKVATVDEMRPMNTVKRAQMTRINSKFITSDAFAMRKVHDALALAAILFCCTDVCTYVDALGRFANAQHYYTASQKKHGMKGALREKVKSEAMNQMMNPNSMLEMMKGNMTFMVSNFVMMGLMSYFFGGFVLAKVPFSLTQKFKSMLQRGIELNTLDVSYVSSVSWYFLVMFGMRGFLSLILGEQSASDDSKAMQMQMGMGAGPNVGFDAPKVYKQERVSLRLHSHEWFLEHAEKKLLGEPIPKKPTPAAATSALGYTSSTTSTTTVEKRSSKFNKVQKKR